MTPTEGIIVESTAVSGAWHRRAITYEYTAYGVHHRGERLFGWGRSIPSTFYEVGQRFPVYFVTGDPASSYAPYPPSTTGFVVFAVIFLALGITITWSTWRAYDT